MISRGKNKTGYYFLGFTLIELLVVIAILGVLAVVVLLVINPAEKQAQARDTGRIASVQQLGRALQTYFTSTGGYPSTGSWAQDMIDAGEFQAFPAGIDYTYGSASECSALVQPALNPTYCYDFDETDGSIIFATAESNKYNSECISPEAAYFVFSTADARGGTICNNGDPSSWAPGSVTYLE